MEDKENLVESTTCSKEIKYIKDIIMTRGNTFAFKFQRLDENCNVIETVAEKMIFTVKEDYETDEILFQKSLADGNITFSQDDYYYHIVIQPDDTRKLNYTTYYWDVKVIEGDYEFTIIKERKLKIEKAVTD